MSQTPRLEEVINGAMNERLTQMWTAIPASVISYNSTNQTINMKVQIVAVFTNSDGEKQVPEHPTIYNVPVLFPGGRSATETHRITWPLKAGDSGLYIISTLPIGAWRKNGKPSSVDIRGSEESSRNGLTGSGFFLPGIFAGNAPTTAPTDAMVIHGKTKIGGDTGTEPTFMADKFMKHFNNFLDVLASELNGVAPGLGTTIKAAWSSAGLSSSAPSGVKTTKTEVK